MTTTKTNLLVSDFAAIEARVLAWLAGQEDVLRLFRDGEDVYKVLAGKIYGKDADDVEKPERFVGKVATLGLGYGMGPKKFRETCAKFGQELDEDFCKKVVEVYRESNSRIRQFWYDLDKATVAVIKNFKIGRPSSKKVGKVTVDWHERWLRIKLPSGRRLYYLDPEIKMEPLPWDADTLAPRVYYMGMNSYTNRWELLNSYGGKWAENATQAVARDLLAESLLRVEAAGLRPAMHVHDEIVCEITHENPEFELETLEQLMCKLPDWAEGCPIAAEGFVSRRYRK